MTDAAAEPLHPSMWGRLTELVHAAERSVEDNAEMAALHARATAFVNSWESDPDAAFNHLMSAVSGLAAALRIVAAVVPAAGALVPIINQVSQAVQKMHDLMTPPGPPPELPPIPEAAAEPVQALPPLPAPEPLPASFSAPAASVNAPQPDHAEMIDPA